MRAMKSVTVSSIATAVLALCIARVSAAQNSAILPPLAPIVLQGETNATCPSEEILQKARNGMRTEVQAYLKLLTNSGANESFPASSCQLIAQFYNAISDYYWIRTANGSATRLYCDMSTHCGEPGWTRAAFINMTDSSQSCPNELAEMNYTGIRVCKRRAHNACDSVNFIVPVSYTKVCGRIIGYQIGTSDAFCAFQNYCDYRRFHHTNRAYTIDDVYVDGLSLTRGTPREHIWTFANAINDVDRNRADFMCPCTLTGLSGIAIPPFVGNNYFCDTGNHRSGWYDHVFYKDDPLWDGAGCRAGTCCTFNTPPWFVNQLSGPITDPLELHSCGDQPANTENVGIQLLEIYVQ